MSFSLQMKHKEWKRKGKNLVHLFAKIDKEQTDWMYQCRYGGKRVLTQKEKSLDFEREYKLLNSSNYLNSTPKWKGETSRGLR